MSCFIQHVQNAHGLCSWFILGFGLPSLSGGVDVEAPTANVDIPSVDIPSADVDVDAGADTG